jgi:hypothetical protein
MASAIGILAACGTPDAASVASSSFQAGMATDASTAAPSETTTPPAITHRTVTVTRRIAYRTRTVKDSSLATGVRRVRTRGVTGRERLTYTVAYEDGVQKSKRLRSRVVVKAPITQITVVGTKKKSSCDPNYSGCVPIASDVDCAGGSGNGPAYVSGQVDVVGSDIYDLDRDGDGVACD